MNFRFSLLTALAALTCAAVPVSALPLGYTLVFPEQPPLWSGGTEGGDDDGLLEISLPPSWVSASFGCMGTDNGFPRGYVMVFQPDDGPSFHASVSWQEESPANPSSVPDGGSTFTLLGLALAGFVAVRRRRISRASA